MENEHSFTLMHRDDIVTKLVLNETGSVVMFSADIKNPELIPFGSLRNGKLNFSY